MVKETRTLWIRAFISVLEGLAITLLLMLALSAATAGGRLAAGEGSTRLSAALGAMFASLRLTGRTHAGAIQRVLILLGGYLVLLLLLAVWSGTAVSYMGSRLFLPVVLGAVLGVGPSFVKNNKKKQKCHIKITRRNRR